MAERDPTPGECVEALIRLIGTHHDPATRERHLRLILILARLLGIMTPIRDETNFEALG